MASTPGKADRTEAITANPKLAESLGEEDLAAMSKANGETLSVMMDAGEAMMRGMASINEEMAAFASSRIQENLVMSQSLMRCEGAEEALGLQRSFAQKATEQYLAEATRLLTLTTQLARSSWAPVQHQAEGALKQVKKQSA